MFHFMTVSYETEIVIITMLCLHIADVMGIICITRAKSFSPTTLIPQTLSRQIVAVQ